jgi:hypothetical protein
MRGRNRNEMLLQKVKTNTVACKSLFSDFIVSHGVAFCSVLTIDN